jgi:integrase
MRFTDANAAALKLDRGKPDRIEFDDQRPGLGVRVRILAGNRIQRTWVVQLRVAGRSQRHDLGPVTATPARRARELADEIFAKVRKGGDPKAEKIANRDENLKTYGPLAAEYLALKEQSLRPRSYVEVARHLERYFERLDGLPARSVTGKLIDRELKRIADEHGPIAANRARRSLSALFAWALKKTRVDKNPVIETDKRIKEVSRDRVLSDDELKAIWTACADDDHGKIVRLLMLTGQRRDEVGGIAESELDRKGRVWSLPRERTKNGRPHNVPLADAALALLPAPRSGREFLFGRGAGSFAGWSRCKTRLDNRIKAANDGKGIPAWRLHDLRRTAASGMAKLGANLPVIEKILNHVSGSFGGIVGVYQHHDFADEKRQALEAWAAHVEELLSDKPSNVEKLVADNVVKIPRRRRR